MSKRQKSTEKSQETNTLKKAIFYPYIADIIRSKCKEYGNPWIESNLISELLLEDSKTGRIIEADYMVKVDEVGKSTPHHTATIMSWVKNIVAHFSAQYTAPDEDFKCYSYEFERKGSPGKYKYRLKDVFSRHNAVTLFPLRTTKIPYSRMKEHIRRKEESQMEIGRLGEELVARVLRSRVESEQIEDFEWTSDADAMAPYDFRLQGMDGNLTLIDVKSTTFSFETPFYMSRAEIQTGFMGGKEYKYCIYRVYDLDMDKKTGKMRVSDNLKSENYANYFDFLENVPDGIYIDNVKIKPSKLYFNPEVSILQK